jgi:hypothetical protein
MIDYLLSVICKNPFSLQIWKLHV